MFDRALAELACGGVALTLGPAADSLACRLAFAGTGNAAVVALRSTTEATAPVAGVVYRRSTAPEPCLEFVLLWCSDDRRQTVASMVEAASALKACAGLLGTAAG